MKKILALILAAMMIIGCCSAIAEEAKPLAGKTLKVAMSPDFMFFETVSETDPTGYEGLDIDIIKCLSEALGFEFEIVPMKFSSLIGALQVGDADFVISGMSRTDERAKVVDFSMVYVTTDVGCVVPVDSAIACYKDLEGKIVCCSAGTTYEGIIEGIPGAQLKTFEGQAAVGTAVAQASDGVVAGLTSINGSKKLANTILDTEGKAMLKYFVLDSDSAADHYNIAFPQGSELVALFDAEIQKMIDSGKMDELAKFWLY